MSQGGVAGLDPADQQGRLDELTTNDVPSAQRLAFWRDGVLKRMEPVEGPGDGQPFQARLRRIAVDGAELVVHASNAICAVRSPERRRIDDCDDISIDLMQDCQSAMIDHNGEHRLRPGDLRIVDYSQPIRILRSRHRASALILSRARVSAVLGHDLSALAGRHLPARGMAAVLRSHMRATIDEAPRLSTAERHAATTAAADMALAMLRATRFGIGDAEQFVDGFYRAAQRVIARRCADPDLTPDRVTAILGCSRASLYRVFARHDESIAAAIWSARIERAWHLLTSAEGAGMMISNIAADCGFREVPTFTRMFRRRYGMTPREARAASDGAI